ncbi:hypothetical protein AAZX31_01G189200 [Glycine max]|uniref:Protein FAR1-RELATED SEQUENCE n=2 Tax=Glycine subgen. Soja TaxID=1462606 RepID=K7K4V8_SOYBN|nr:hypothetical protein GYH30_002198 [Glycine max]KRH77261.1 hypothetical protein GLYMA_01G202800v4 [Glycine max]RZC30944.1 hypothetical protein D0Y65_002118 [Glycine soja]
MTTSRCEAFHSHLAKFVNLRICFTDFVEQFQRCLSYFCFREIEADFDSDYGVVTLQSGLHSLERSASKVFTKTIFHMFRCMLIRAPTVMRVRECHETSLYSIYSVLKYCDCGSICHVCYCPSTFEFKCSCLRMESFGLPCDHIVTLLVELDFSEIPKCLVLDWWKKKCKKVYSWKICR